MGVDDETVEPVSLRFSGSRRVRKPYIPPNRKSLSTIKEETQSQLEKVQSELTVRELGKVLINSVKEEEVNLFGEPIFRVKLGDAIKKSEFENFKMTGCGTLDLCSGHGTCVIDKDRMSCICDHHFDPETACSSCAMGFSEFEGICYATMCDKACHEHGNCVLWGDVFECRCLSNYDEQSNCEMCRPNFDPSEGCLACRKGFYQDETNNCNVEKLTSSEIGAVCGGSIGFCLIVAVIWCGAIVCARHCREGKVRVK